jgi:hypothetical protein
MRTLKVFVISRGAKYEYFENLEIFQTLQSNRKRKTNVLQFTRPCEHRIEWLCLNSQELLVGGLMAMLMPPSSGVAAWNVTGSFMRDEQLPRSWKSCCAVSCDCSSGRGMFALHRGAMSAAGCSASIWDKLDPDTWGAISLVSTHLMNWSTKEQQCFRGSLVLTIGGRSARNWWKKIRWNQD